MQTVIEHELQVRLVLSPERSIPVPARFSYRVNDPYAVHVTFHVGSRAPVCWTFARELLVEGSFRACGQGDVRIWPTRSRGRSVICVALSSPDGDALLEAPVSPVATWLDRTLQLVPPGTEDQRLDIDEQLGALFCAFTRDELWPGDPCPREEGTEQG
jgi:Streptomyces sporulation and cell division protein, SsgA